MPAWRSDRCRSLFKDLSLGPASVVVPIQGMFIIGGAALGILVLGEPMTAKRVLGMALAIAGVPLVATRGAPKVRRPVRSLDTGTARVVGTPGFRACGESGGWRVGVTAWLRRAAHRGTGLALPAVAAILALSSGARAQGAVRQTFDDWQLRCETPAGAKAEQCAMVQYLAAEDRPNLTLVVIVLKTADNRGYLLRVVAPLGVLLPSGLGLKIDQNDIGRAGFVRCLTTGCVAEVVMDDGLLKSFRSGTQATFIVFQTPEEGVGIPLNLKGFAGGFDALK